MSDEYRASNTEIGYLKGEINGVIVHVWSPMSQDIHKIGFVVSRRKHEPKIRINQHKTPWPDNLIHDGEWYAEDITRSRSAAWRELDERNLSNVGEWRAE